MSKHSLNLPVPGPEQGKKTIALALHKNFERPKAKVSRMGVKPKRKKNGN